ncbi:tRNA pseudouridine(38-40) synthase TruA [Jeotgalibacillus proteolyticus]|uniref:tRNA pseudouridine synthase A n=1 Tax=Jeotgalibacillus proteolyticus TaxID=2082395 RepID=A0A2S5G6S9_9BACL|nr:tRNA pseudouridine(38-40) synthase TruA [Jeotgalibacillus proteolyticus]PPA68634.1 tRNA pseudouridine(38-40) synthase TruA [Jeotgalibacillus proteolyticus]
MPRFKCIISYDGAGFFGYQVQARGRTVQGELERVLTEIHKGKRTRVTASGRTDARVHAVGQVIHFDTDYSIPAERWPVVLNQKLPDDIVVMNVEEADPDFHARFQTSGKEYRYVIDRGEFPTPFRRHYAVHHPVTIDLALMREAARHFVGEHDFTSFSVAKSAVVDRVRTIEYFDIIEQGSEWIFIVKGNGFLYNMVRIMVGTLLEVGSGKYTPADIPEMLKAKNRSAAGKTAPPHGLYLWKVEYGERGKGKVSEEIVE